jgi:WD40 repeat protein
MSNPFIGNFFSPDGKRLVTLDRSGLSWWNLDGASPTRIRELPGRVPFAVSPDGKQVLVGHDLAWCDMMSGECSDGKTYGYGDLDACRFGLMPDGKTVLVGTSKGEVLFAERGDKQNLVVRSRFRVGDGRVYALEVSPDGRMVATYTESGHAVKLWDRTGDKLALHDAPQEGRQIYHIVFSPDGRLFAVADTSDITVWDVQNRPAQQRRRWNEGWNTLSIAFSPDGRTLATASNQGKLALRDIETGETRREWQLPGAINYVTYAPDGRHLLTINGNGTGYILRLAPSPSARVDDAWLKQVAALPAEKQVEEVAAKLKELNPGFDGKVTPSIENGVVTGLVFSTEDVTDISPVRALTRLQGLECSAGGAVGKLRLSDLSPLKELPLTYLHIGGTGVSDLSQLKGMKLKRLICAYTPVSDLSPLKEMPLLESLNCDGCKVSNLSPLNGLKLTELACASTKVSDLSPLQGMPLTVLQCQDLAAVSDLSVLKGLPLKALSCDYKPERDAEILRAIPTLETINGKPAKEVLKAAGDKK